MLERNMLELGKYIHCDQKIKSQFLKIKNGTLQLKIK